MNADDDNVSVIDTATNNVFATVPVEQIPLKLHLARREQRYIWRIRAATIYVIDTATNSVMTSVEVEIILCLRTVYRFPSCTASTSNSKLYQQRYSGLCSPICEVYRLTKKCSSWK
jgi:YVTN family beta-propeller protein